MYFLDLEDKEESSLEKVEPCFINKWVCFSMLGMCQGISNKLNIKRAFGFCFFKIKY